MLVQLTAWTDWCNYQGHAPPLCVHFLSTWYTLLDVTAHDENTQAFYLHTGVLEKWLNNRDGEGLGVRLIGASLSKCDCIVHMPVYTGLQCKFWMSAYTFNKDWMSTCTWECLSNSEGLLPECSIGLNIKRLRVKTTQIELCMGTYFWFMQLWTMTDKAGCS